MAVKILLVEDEAIIAMNEKSLIEQAGFTVVHSFSGEDAVQYAADDPDITLVLMDIDLGKGIEGTEAARLILEIRPLPIVFLTNHTEKDVVEKVKNITSYGYVIKNTGRFVLIESINMALKLFKAHSDLKKSEIEYREIVDGIDSAILKFDREGRIIYFSRGAEKLFGFKESEVIGKLSVESINPKFDSKGNDHAEMMKNIFRDTESYTINENENITRDGRRISVRWYNKAVTDYEGKQMYTLAIGEDVTESNKVFQKIEAAANIHDAFINSSMVMLISRLEDGVVLEVNNKFVQQSGFSREECIGNTMTGLGIITAEEREEIIAPLIKGDGIASSETSAKCKNGNIIRCSYVGLPMNFGKEKQIFSIINRI